MLQPAGLELVVPGDISLLSEIGVLTSRAPLGDWQPSWHRALALWPLTTLLQHPVPGGQLISVHLFKPGPHNPQSVYPADVWVADLTSHHPVPLHSLPMALS